MDTKNLTGLRVAVYARYSSDNQREASIDDQVRRCREFIEHAGGMVDPNLIFADHAISGASLQRPAFEKLMSMVTAKRREVDVIVTEDLSRVTRDFADGAMVFRQLQYLDVPLLGVADGIDTSSRQAKVAFTVKSLLADMHLEELRDKTLRGLKGRILSGYSTGGLAYGYSSHEETDAQRRTIGWVIAVAPEQAAIVRRVYEEYLGGRSLTGIAGLFNAEQIPPPRAHTLHRRKGWVASTIREMLHNETYVGRRSFMRREWRKVPGTNRRLSRLRPESEVIIHEQPELQIIAPEIWNAVQARLAEVRAHYTRDGDGRPKGRSAPGRQNAYLFSGLLQCGCCSTPMVIIGGSSERYYRCGDHHKRRVCSNSLSIRERVVRVNLLAVLREMIMSPEALLYIRERLAGKLVEAQQRATGALDERRQRLARTKQRIDSLTDVIADGERSEALLQKLRDLEAQARDEKAAIEVLEQQARESMKVPSAEEMFARVFDLEARLMQDPLRGREELRRLFRDGVIRLDPQADGVYIARGEVLPLVAYLAPNVQRPGSGDPNRAVYSDGCGGSILPLLHGVTVAIEPDLAA